MSARRIVIEGDLLRGRDAIDLGGDLFDAVLSDPPYELGFMGKSWDASGVAFDPKTWKWIASHLRPGAPLLAFGGTRTHHRMMCAIEDGGFEIRDCLSWLYASGFPKSLNISKAIDAAADAERPVIGSQTLTGNAAVSTKDKGGTFGVQVGVVPPKTVPITGPATELAKTWDGFGTALKPAWEPVVLARKPLAGTVAANVAEHGVGGIAIDACRIGWSGPEDAAAAAAAAAANGFAGSRARGTAKQSQSIGKESRDGNNNYDPDALKGRWPANVLLDEESAPLLDSQSGDRPSGVAVLRNGGGGQIFGHGVGYSSRDAGYTDSGGASRFFFTSKVSTSERNDGLDDLPELSAADTTNRDPASAGNGPRAGAAGGAGAPRYRCSLCNLHLGRGRAVSVCPKGGAHVPVLIGHGAPARNPHPTMKPVALTEYLAKLILPPRGIGRPRRLLVPFCGVGSEMIGALRAGWDEVIGIEMSAEYAHIARLRLARCDTSHQPELFGT